MTLERLVAIRDHLIHQNPLEPPMSASELLSILNMAERWFRLAQSIKEEM